MNLEWCAFPSFSRRGGRDPNIAQPPRQERPGWLRLERTNHPGCASQGTGPFLEGAPLPLLEKEGNAHDSNSLRPSNVHDSEFTHTFKAHDSDSFTPSVTARFLLSALAQTLFVLSNRLGVLTD